MDNGAVRTSEVFLVIWISRQADKENVYSIIIILQQYHIYFTIVSYRMKFINSSVFQFPYAPIPYFSNNSQPASA